MVGRPGVVVREGELGMSHGGVPPGWLLRADGKSRFAQRAAPPEIGATNLFGPIEPNAGGGPGSSEEFQGYGERTEAILVKVARLLAMPYAWGPGTPGAADGDIDGDDDLDEDENPRIPSGYTYLAQLVAHDISFLGSILPPLPEAAEAGPNLRTRSLDLQTIYGGGPLERPFAFCPATNGGPRVQLRVGLVEGWKEASQEARAGFGRDLPRARCPLTADDVAGGRRGLTEVLVADPRNDDHLIIAQTAALFHLLHNAICERLADNPAAFSPEHADDEPRPPTAFTAQERDVFTSARRLTAAVYRDIVRSDLMKRLLCDAVYARYARAPRPFLGGGDGGVPVEFSHAAYRIGHAMVRTNYVIRNDAPFDLDDVLRFTSERAADRMPPSRAWTVRWSHFYEVETPHHDHLAGPVRLNLSRRLAPSYSPALTASALISVTDDRDDPDLRTGIQRRDLLRGASVRMRSVESLVARIRRAAPDLIDPASLLGPEDPAARRAAVRAFLDRGDGLPDRLTDAEKDQVAADPPLLLFLLLEAAVDQGGLCLGILGSVIVGEVVFGALAAAEAADTDGWPEIGALATTAFGYDPDAMAQGRYQTRTPLTMPELIRFLAGLPGVAATDLPFA